jgi:outer membrane protein assembly factor BamB
VKRFGLFLLSAILLGCTISPSPVLPPVELTSIENPLYVRSNWNSVIGSGVGENYLKLQPVFAGSIGYVADYQGYVRAFEVITGERQWELQLELPIASGPAVVEDKLLFGTSQGEVLAHDLRNGKELWRAVVSSEVLAQPRGEDGVVVIRTVDGRVYGLAADNGERLWVYDRSVPLLTLRGNSAPVIHNGIVIVGSDSGKLAALTLKTGRVLWETQIADPRGRTELERMVDIDVQPVVMEDVVYVVTYQGRLATVQLDSGRMLWARDISSYSGMALDPYRVYITDSESQVWALNRFNGATLWRQDKLLRRSLTGPVLQGPYLVVADYDGYVHWLKREDGRIVARKRVNQEWHEAHEDDFAEVEDMFSKANNILAAPKEVDSMILVMDRLGHIAAFELERP